MLRKALLTPGCPTSWHELARIATAAAATAAAAAAAAAGSKSCRFAGCASFGAQGVPDRALGKTLARARLL